MATSLWDWEACKERWLAAQKHTLFNVVKHFLWCTCFPFFMHSESWSNLKWYHLEAISVHCNVSRFACWDRSWSAESWLRFLITVMRWRFQKKITSSILNGLECSTTYPKRKTSNNFEASSPSAVPLLTSRLSASSFCSHARRAICNLRWWLRRDLLTANHA